MKSSHRKNRRKIKKELAARVCPYEALKDNTEEAVLKTNDMEYFSKSLLESIFQQGIIPKIRTARQYYRRINQ